MFIPDVINTLLMGLIFMVIVVTVVRPFVLHIVNGAMTTEDLQKEAIEAVQQEMMRVSMVAEAQRNDQILFQQSSPKPVCLHYGNPNTDQQVLYISFSPP